MTKLQDFGIERPLIIKKRFEIIKTIAFIVKDMQENIIYDKYIDWDNNEKALIRAKELQRELSKEYGEFIQNENKSN